MFNNENEIEKIVSGFCIKNKIDKNIFEISNIAYSQTGGKEERIYNKTKVKNKKCTYIIKYYKALNIIVIWNYAINHNMSYSYKTIKQKLSNGIRYGDKGTGFHTNNQYYVYFDKGEKLNELLKLIYNPI